MKIQLDWVLKMEPISVMLKFRLPNLYEEIEFLDGDIIFQPWAPPNTCETRLISSYPYNFKKYNLDEYSNRMLERKKEKLLILTEYL